MNKYELAVVVNVKLEDEERAAVIEKVKEYIVRFGGTVTDVEEWGKKRLAYEIQKMHITTSSNSSQKIQIVQTKLKITFVSWKM